MKVLSLLYFLNSFTNLQVVSFSFTVFQKQNRIEVYSVTVAYRSCSNENNIAFFDHLISSCLICAKLWLTTSKKICTSKIYSKFM